VVCAPPRTVPWKLRLKWLRERPVALLLGVFLVGVPPALFPLHYWILTRIESQVAGGIDYHTLSRHGKDASGNVVGVSLGEDITLYGEQPWIVAYQFEADGREHSGEMKTLDRSVVADWQAGHPVHVKYLGPESMITDVKPYRIPIWKIYVICVVGNMGVGLPFLAYAIAGMRNKATLYRSGLLTRGKISAMRLATWLGFMPLFRFRFKVTYRFQDHDGNEVLGSSISTNVALLNGGKQGDPVDVLFLESRPEVNCLAEEQDLLALAETR